MSKLRLASADTKRIELGDEDFLVVKNDLSKRDFNGILKLLPPDYDSDSGFTFGQASDFACALFDCIVTGWSLDVEPTVENYLDLAQDAASAVDQALAEHFNSLTPSAEERTKSKGSRS